MRIKENLQSYHVAIFNWCSKATRNKILHKCTQFAENETVTQLLFQLWINSAPCSRITTLSLDWVFTCCVMVTYKDSHTAVLLLAIFCTTNYTGERLHCIATETHWTIKFLYHQIFSQKLMNLMQYENYF